MLIWSGLGFLVPIIAFVWMLVTSSAVNAAFHDDEYFGAHAWPGLLVIALSASSAWLLARRLDRQPGRRLVDPATGREVILKPRHSLFFTPPRFWPLLVILVGLAIEFAL